MNVSIGVFKTVRRSRAILHLLRPGIPIMILMAMISGCKKDDPAPDPTPSLPPTISHRMEFVHHVDGAPLLFDSLIYVNEAGHQFSVSRLQYYISDIVLYGTGNTADHSIAGTFHIDGRNASTLDLPAIPSGTYGGVSLVLGLPPEMNVTNALPNTMENIEMAWPEPMGGGYHFMKFEGHFINAGSQAGYAMHLGRNENLPQCDVSGAFAISSTSTKLIFRFNLNEVFRSPHTYDLSSGNYSMGSAALMALLRDNCTDVFTLEVQQ